MIDFKNVYKSYGEQVLLDAVSFRINPGERVGFVGPNGSGKSTVFGMICGDVLPDKGAVGLPKSMTIGYLRQQLPSRGFELSLKVAVRFEVRSTPVALSAGLRVPSVGGVALG